MQGLNVVVWNGSLFITVEQEEYLADLKKLEDHIRMNQPLAEVAVGETTLWIRGAASVLYEILQWIVDHIDNTTSKVHVGGAK